MTRMRVWATVLLALVLTGCAEEGRDATSLYARSTYEKFLVRAEGGDAEAQHLVGFMLFFGEGVAEDKAEAHYWFHRAAEQNHQASKLNLAVMHSLGDDAELDRAEADRLYAELLADTDGAGRVDMASAMDGLKNWKPEAPHPGRQNYETYCAGCHGLNGIARFVGSPSFAIGERMEKPDKELRHSIAYGKGVMPDWLSKLGAEEVDNLLAYVRTLKDRYSKGIALVLRSAPDQYYTFGPMTNESLDAEEPGIRQPPPSRQAP